MVLDKKELAKMIGRVIAVTLPFALLYWATDMWFRDVYLLEWMRRRLYLLAWLAAGIAVPSRPGLAYVIAYGDIFSIIFGEVLGGAILANNKLTATPEDYLVPCHGKLSHQGFWIWLETYFAIIVLYIAYVRVVEPWIKARRERRGK